MWSSQAHRPRSSITLAELLPAKRQAPPLVKDFFGRPLEDAIETIESGSRSLGLSGVTPQLEVEPLPLTTVLSPMACNLGVGRWFEPGQTNTLRVAIT
jgi:hypothetical protein